MTDVTQLISAVSPHIPFANAAAAQAFLSQFNVDDQAALISAMYIGRDHIHSTQIEPNYVPQGMTFDRFFTTGNAPSWDIPPSHFARILYEKNTNVATYYAAFLRCAQASGYSLATF